LPADQPFSCEIGWAEVLKPRARGRPAEGHGCSDRHAVFATMYYVASILDLCGLNFEVSFARLGNSFARNSPLSLSLPFLLSILFSQFYFSLSPSDHKSYFNLQEYV
jgi:hypothetical protein